MITINDSNNRDDHEFDYPTLYPFRLNDGVQLPTDTTGLYTVWCQEGILKKYTSVSQNVYVSDIYSIIKELDLFLLKILDLDHGL